MAFFWQRLLILFLLASGGGQMFAANSHEQRAYSAAYDAFQDKFYERAETNLTQFLQDYSKSTNAPAAVLLLAQAQFYQGKFQDAIARLTDTNDLDRAQMAGLADRYLYWTAEAKFASGDTNGAAEMFVALPERFPRSPLTTTAVVEAAAAFKKLGNWQRVDELLDDSNGAFQRAVRSNPTNQIVADGRLLQAESKLVQRNFSAAIRILELLQPATLAPEQDWKRALLFCRANLGQNNLDAALIAATNLLQIAHTNFSMANRQDNGWSERVAESVDIHGRALEQAGRLADAIDAWHENLTNNASSDLREQAILKTADLAVALNNLTNAEANLTLYLALFPTSPQTALARVTLAELYLKDAGAQPVLDSNRLAAAQSALDTAPTNGPLGGKAFLDRGWCDWLGATLARQSGDSNAAVQLTANSLSDFSAAARMLPMSDDLAVARFKMGDAQFALGDFAGAQTNYQAVLTDFVAITNVISSLGDRALYQILRAQLELHDANGMTMTMEQLLGKFFTNAPSDSSLLLEGQGFSNFGSPAKARQVFQRFEVERPGSSLVPDVAFAVGRTYEREQNWSAAVTNYERWLQAYPTNHLRPQVEYARDWAVAQAGDEGRAFELFTNFCAKYPTDTNTPPAYWWVADYYFRQGTNFVDAEKNYQAIYLVFPTNNLACPAQLMAGRAAIARFGYSDAINSYLTHLLNNTNCPEDLRDQARFAYCEASRLMSPADTNYVSLQAATNILAQMYPKAATNIVGALAWCETGNLDLQMNAFDAATNAYIQALNSPAATQELRCKAKVGIGLALEKKADGLPDDQKKSLLAGALNNYLDVVYAKGNEFWIKEAAVHALHLIGDAGAGNEEQLSRFFDRVENLLPQMKDALEKKRASLKG